MATDKKNNGDFFVFECTPRDFYAYYYKRHVILFHKNPASWPPSFEPSNVNPLLKLFSFNYVNPLLKLFSFNSDPLPYLFASTWSSHPHNFTSKIIITICEVREDLGFSQGDVLIIPDMMKYRGLVVSNVERFFEDVLANGKPWVAGEEKVSTHSHIYVSAHGSQDVELRQLLINEFIKQIAPLNLKDNIFVNACSHVGWPINPGNVVIYIPGPFGNIMGHWYLIDSPNDVPGVVDRHISKKRVVSQLLRGQMDPSEFAYAELLERRKNEKDIKGGKNDNSYCCGRSCCCGGFGVVAAAVVVAALEWWQQLLLWRQLLLWHTKCRDELHPKFQEVLEFPLYFTCYYSLIILIPTFAYHGVS